MNVPTSKQQKITRKEKDQNGPGGKVTAWEIKNRPKTREGIAGLGKRRKEKGNVDPRMDSQALHRRALELLALPPGWRMEGEEECEEAMEGGNETKGNGREKTSGGVEGGGNVGVGGGRGKNGKKKLTDACRFPRVSGA